MCADFRVVRNPWGLEERTPNLAIAFPFDDGFMTEPPGIGAICAEELQERWLAEILADSLSPHPLADAGDLFPEGEVLGPRTLATAPWTEVCNSNGSSPARG